MTIAAISAAGVTSKAGFRALKRAEISAPSRSSIGMSSPVAVPRSTVERYHEMLTTGGLLSGKAPVDYANIVDTRYLKRALKELGVAWDPAKVDP